MNSYKDQLRVALWHRLEEFAKLLTASTEWHPFAHVVLESVEEIKRLERELAASEAAGREMVIVNGEAFDRIKALEKRSLGPKTPPRYSLSVYQDADYEFTADELGDWVKWEDIASLFATGMP